VQFYVIDIYCFRYIVNLERVLFILRASSERKLMRRNHRNRRSNEPPKHVVVAFDPADTLRLHALGVKFPETLLIEAARKEVIQSSATTSEVVAVMSRV